ncbi:MAG: hypothetical protein P8078_07105 [bacterium]
MHKTISHIISILLIFYILQNIDAQTLTLEGQASLWNTLNIEKIDQPQAGIRYIPSMLLQHSISRTGMFDLNCSLNMYATADYNENGALSEQTRSKFYRIWLRYSATQFEARVGLQKINFGPAAMLRSLMWFDRLDPRDPLQITEGVYGLLLRYYFLNNSNIWFWMLLGNNSRKGWEVLPSTNSDLEIGGRLQSPVPLGEVGFSYHQRKVDINKGLKMLPLFFNESDVDIPSSEFIRDYFDLHNFNEYRYSCDGKWDVEIGIWLESVLIYRDLELLPYQYQQMLTMGADYTFALGNGVHVMGEHLFLQYSKEMLGSDERNDFSAFSLNYPLGILDTMTGIIFYDWNNEDVYRFLRLQRQYDRWGIYLMMYWNPKKFQIYNTFNDNSLFSGKGFQIMVVFNH